jgi:hypothetical protein
MPFVQGVNNSVATPSCNGLCGVTPSERDQCCRTNGHLSFSHCDGLMHCKQGVNPHVATPSCNGLCGGTQSEKDQCCRTNGRLSYSHCTGTVYCNE